MQLTSGQILLVRKDEEQTLLHFSITQYTVQLLLCFIDPISVLAIDHKYETLRASVVVSPQRPDLVLSSDIPYVKFDVLVGNSLDVEADCLDRARISQRQVTRKRTDRLE